MPPSENGHGSGSLPLRMSSARARIVVGLTLLCYCLVYQLDRSQPSFYSRICSAYRDTVARNGRLTDSNPDLVFLAIDADSVGLDPVMDAPGLPDPNCIENRAFALMTQRFPWSREIYGLILERLVEAGAKVVLFDLTFPWTAEGDAAFHQALNKYGEHAVIGSNFVNPSWNGQARVGAALTRPVDTLVPATSPTDDRIGYTNYWGDEDGIVRRAFYHITFEQVEERMPGPESERFVSLPAQACRKMGKDNFVPADVESHVFRFTGWPLQAFRPHSVFEIFVPRYWKSNYKSGEFFRGKTVIVGAQGSWQHDELQTPLGTMPGPELHLQVINAALKGEFIREMPAGSVPLLAALAALLAVAITFLAGSPWIRLGFLVIIDVAAAGAALFAFNRFGLYLPLIGALTALNFSVLLGMLTDFTQEHLEKKRVRRTLERYVSRDLVSQMLDNSQTYQESLGGTLKPVTILFSDIRGFSSVSTQLEPEVLVRQLNEYLGAMVECVFQFEGTLDKFIGDAVMAVWGNIRTHGPSSDAANAVNAARAMREQLQRLNRQWSERGWPELKIGVGVHHGPVVVGNVGSPQRMEFTVIGEAVNVTWKLQEYTKKVGCPFLMSGTVRDLLGDQLPTAALGEASLPGLQQPVKIFTLSGLEPRPNREEANPSIEAATSSLADSKMASPVPSPHS